MIAEKAKPSSIVDEAGVFLPRQRGRGCDDMEKDTSHFCKNFTAVKEL
jgi:hypothetical protein